jgi:hypothetical protein
MNPEDHGPDSGNQERLLVQLIGREMDSQGRRLDRMLAAVVLISALNAALTGMDLAITYAGFSFVAEAEGAESDTGMVPIVPGWLGPNEDGRSVP